MCLIGVKMHVNDALNSIYTTNANQCNFSVCCKTNQEIHNLQLTNCDKVGKKATFLDYKQSFSQHASNALLLLLSMFCEEIIHVTDNLTIKEAHLC